MKYPAHSRHSSNLVPFPSPWTQCLLCLSWGPFMKTVAECEMLFNRRTATLWTNLLIFVSVNLCDLTKSHKVDQRLWCWVTGFGNKAGSWSKTKESWATYRCGVAFEHSSFGGGAWVKIMFLRKHSSCGKRLCDSHGQTLSWHEKLLLMCNSVAPSPSLNHADPSCGLFLWRHSSFPNF